MDRKLDAKFAEIVLKKKVIFDAGGEPYFEGMILGGKMITGFIPKYSEALGDVMPTVEALIRSFWQFKINHTLRFGDELPQWRVETIHPFLEEGIVESKEALGVSESLAEAFCLAILGAFE